MWINRCIIKQENLFFLLYNFIQIKIRGCSPVGMKKSYKTVIDAACENVDTIIVSAGKIGYQIEIKPKELVELVRGEIESIIH